MKRMLISGAALALAITGVGVGSAAPGSPAGGNGSVACNDGTVTWDPTSIWPPNHKMQTVNITYTAGEGGVPTHDSSSVLVGLITHDQMLVDGTELNGSGNTPVDATGTGRTASGAKGDPIFTTAEVRQERSGREQDGRVYTIQVTCTDYNGALAGTPVGDPTADSETVSITVDVPHDQRRIKTDDGS